MTANGAEFDPETIETMHVALDMAWATLKPAERTELKRVILAERILAATAQGERDPGKLRDRALDFPTSGR
ncbi:MAG TPA: hypothetical protein VJ800_10075 [Pseudolabrys sp.]|nr:hypothetical protein [Pseudolabrys sp.]